MALIISGYLQGDQNIYIFPHNTQVQEFTATDIVVKAINGHVKIKPTDFLFGIEWIRLGVLTINVLNVYGVRKG